MDLLDTGTKVGKRRLEDQMLLRDRITLIDGFETCNPAFPTSKRVPTYGCHDGRRINNAPGSVVGDIWSFPTSTARRNSRQSVVAAVV